MEYKNGANIAENKFCLSTEMNPSEIPTFGFIIPPEIQMFFRRKLGS